MIKIRRNCKEIEGKSFGARKSVKTREKQGSAKFRSLKEASAKSALCCETISQPQQVRCEIVTSLRNRHFVAKPFHSPIAPLCENFRSCQGVSVLGLIYKLNSSRSSFLLRTNGLKRQISNFLAKENEKFYECWERYMEAINACPLIRLMVA